MNTANLQLEGLLMAVAAINQALVSKGVLTSDEIEHALHVCEQTAQGDDRSEQLSPANRDAIAFPSRLLRLANASARSGAIPPFSELTRQVGETKPKYNDQV